MKLNPGFYKVTALRTVSLGSRQAVRHPALAGHSGVRIIDMHYVYILQSNKDHKFYIGETNNIKERLAYHNRGKVISTRSRRPMQLIGYETYKTRAEARKREIYIKSLKGGKTFYTILKHWGVAKR